MAFDINSAVPIKQNIKPKFDISSAVPISTEQINIPKSKQMGFGKTLGVMASNIPESAKNTALGVINGIKALVPGTNEAKGFGNLIIGGIQKLVPGTQGNEPYVDEFMKQLTNRYGGFEQLKNTAVNDPVGFATDLAGAFTGLGSIVSKAGQVSKLNTLIKAGKTASEIGNAINPISLTTKGAGVAIKGTGKTLSPFSGQVNKEVLEASQRLGVPTTASTLSRSPVVQSLEAIGGRGLFGNSINNKIQEIGNSINQIADNTINKINVNPNPVLAGKSVLDSMERFKNKWLDVKTKLYENAVIPKMETKLVPKNANIVIPEELKNVDWASLTQAERDVIGNFAKPVASGGIQVTPNRSFDFAKTILEKKKGAEEILGKSTDIGYFENLYSTLSSVVDGRKMKFAIQELNKKIGNINDPIATGNKAELVKLVTLMSDDFDDAIRIQRPDLARNLDRANAVYKAGLERVNSAWNKNIQKLAESGRSEQIVSAITHPSTDIKQINQIYKTVGKETKEQIQSTFLYDLFKKAKSEETGTFKPLALSNEIKKYGIDKMQAILNPGQFDSVKDLAILSKSLGIGQKMARGSQTAFIGRVGFELSSMFSNPILALKLILGDLGYTTFIKSDIGQKWLTAGFTGTQKSGQNLINFSPVIGKIGIPLSQGRYFNNNK